MKYLEPNLAYLEETDLYTLPKRPADSHKGTFGKLLIVAGSKNMAGAAILSAKSAYRCGTGLVKVVTPEANRIILQTAVPEVILSTFDDVYDENDLLEDIRWADAIVVGPGLGQSTNTYKMMRFILNHANSPVLWDADALNIWAKNLDTFDTRNGRHIFTPHLKEFSRLSGKSILEIKENKIESAKAFAKEYNVICVLKDYQTVIATTSDLSFLNLSGNNGMATAGSGDVLSGIIGALLAQGMSAENSAVYGAYIHGAAGDLARKKTGVHAMMASDIIEELKSLWKKVDENAE